MVYFVMALALFADDDYEEVAARLTETLRGWGCWDADWEVPTRGGITQARQAARPGAAGGGVLAGRRTGRGPGHDRGVPGAVAADVGGRDGVGCPGHAANRAAFGSRAGSEGQAAFPKIRVVTVSECASHAAVLAAMGPAAGGKGSGEQSLARRLLPRLEEDWLLIADRNFYCWKDWCAAADTGAALLWRVKSTSGCRCWSCCPTGRTGRCWSTRRSPGRSGRRLLEAARRGEDLDQDQARYVRVIEYEVPDREGDGKDELIALITTITDPRLAPAAELAQAYHQRWEHETGNQQLKTYLRGPGKVLRSQSPDMVEQEIWGYLLTHYAISALTCAAATAAGIDPDRVKFTRTVRDHPPGRRPGFSPLTRAAAPPGPGHGRHHQDEEPQPAPQAPHLPPRRQTRTAQLLPRQETRRPRHPPRRPAHDQARQPRKSPGRSMINLS